MKLKEHPLMRFGGVRNWPPVWTNFTRRITKTVSGEVGFLRHVRLDDQSVPNKCFLLIEHEGEYFTGSLIFDDGAFCRQIADLLRKHIGHPIKEIGDLDVSHTL